MSSKPSILNKPQLKTKEFTIDGLTVTFREMEVADYPDVRNFVQAVSKCSLFHETEHVAQLLQLPTYHPCCAYLKSELVGYCELYRLPHVGRSFDGRIERVVVKENFRGKGLATAMCDHLIKEAEEHLDCNRIDLTVEKPDARHIYETKLGFKPVSTTVMRLQFPRE